MAEATPRKSSDLRGELVVESFMVCGVLGLGRLHYSVRKNKLNKMKNNEEILHDIFNSPRLVRINGDYIELFDETDWRPIPLRECRSDAGIVAWLLHFLTKDWFTKQHVEQFISAVYDEFPELDKRK